MSDLLERLNNLPHKRLALLAMELQDRLESQQAAEAAGRGAPEPVAIIGMGCRLPGAGGLEEFWQLLVDGGDAIREIPPDRWDVDAYYDPDPDVVGAIATRWAGTLDGIDRFEPQMFGISPREARSLDPQQRLLLEVAWEALEHAGIAPDAVRDIATGVYVGICNNDYGQLLIDDADDIDMYVSTGNASSVASGRLSYVLGLQGPAITVDTACSSSLVAVDLAVGALRSGQCRMAIAGGANVLLSHKTTMTLSRAKMMASDGRCKAFDSRADGFVRGEGCGLVVLKRWSDAVADGDRVLALIRGAAMNQDGRSNGLTAPNGPSQVSVIRAALEDACVEPSAVSYVETHGTGTALGDPIEVQALGTALGRGRDPGNRLRIASVKTNIGHLESAAGIAGLIKVVLAMQHRELPPSLHLVEPNPYIPWDELSIDVVTERTAWRPAPMEGEPPTSLIAGVSSFGFSGTNAHLILESVPPQETTRPDATRTHHAFKLAARTPTALQRAAREVGGRLAMGGVATLDAARTLDLGRADLDRRLVVVAPDAVAAGRALSAWSDGTDVDGIADGDRVADRKPGRGPEVAFLFTGHGAQHAGMGRQLYESEPHFRDAIDRCAAMLTESMDVDLRVVLFDERRSDELLADMATAQPAVFAIEYALAAVWESWGVRPSVVAGHSVGEYVAAVVAGVMSVDDGLRLVAARGRLMSSLPPNGEMATVFASEAEVRDAIERTGSSASIAAINGPTSIAVSGVGGQLDVVLDELRRGGFEVRPLAIPVAAHSSQVDPILDEFEAVARTVTYREPRIDVVSGLHGRLATGDDLRTAAYWRRHLREPVRFGDAFTTIHSRGIRTFVEIGPHPTLLNIGRHIVDEHECSWLPSMRSGRDEWRQLLESAGAMYVAGARVAWDAIVAPGGHVADLPTYPFERDRFWIESRGGSRRAEPGAHPLLGRRFDTPALDGAVFETRLAATWPAFLDHHRVFGAALLPSPAYLEMAAAAGHQLFGGDPIEIAEFEIREAMVLPDDGELVIQLLATPPVGGGRAFEVVARDQASGNWTKYATGRLRRRPDQHDVAVDRAECLDLDEVRGRCTEHVPGAMYYERLRELGLEFGDSFRGVREIWRRDGEALGRIVLPDSISGATRGYDIHPAVLDAAFHVLGAPLPDTDDGPAYLLVGIEQCRLPASSPDELWSHAVLHPGFESGEGGFSGDIRLHDREGDLVGEVLGIHLRHASRDAMLRSARRIGRDWSYEVAWRPLEHRTIDGSQMAVRDLAAVGGERLDSVADDLRVSEVALDALDRAAVSLIPEALSALGIDLVPGSVIERPSLAALVGDDVARERLLARLLGIVSDEGHLEPHADGWSVRSTPRLDPPDFDGLRQRHPGAADEIALVERCGRALTDVLSGRVDPLDLLFPRGDHEMAARIYAETTSARALNAVVGDLVARLGAAGDLRILEIGAGTGATTRTVRAAAGAPVEYWFTDVSPAFVARAEETLDTPDGHGATRFATLDIELGPGGTPLEGRRFDVVIAANVLHATRDLAESLGHARTLLEPGGHLILVEAVRRRPAVDITFGLTSGWWRFSDVARRSAHPLLDEAQWLALLAELGWDAAVVHGETVADASGQVVLVARPSTVGAEVPQRWVIVGDQADPLVVAIGDVLGRRSSTYAVVSDASTLSGALGARVDRIVDVRTATSAGSDGDDLAVDPAAITDALAEAVRTVQVAVSGAPAARLWMVTRRAQAVADVPVDPAGAPVWGLGRVVGLEHPDQWGGVIDLEGADPIREAEALVDAAMGARDEDQVAVRAGGILVPRLIRRAAGGSGSTFRADPESAYLVTGGLGGIGVEVMAWLAERGAGTIVVTGRSGLPEREHWDTIEPGSRAADQVAGIRNAEAKGARIVVTTADVADRSAMSELIARFGADLPPLAGVFHLAAALGGMPVADLTSDEVARMLGPKVSGTWILHDLTRDLPLDVFVTFSSTTGWFGSTGLGHYAAANQFMDAFAAHRRRLGLPALSVGWGTWEQMRVASADERAVIAASGLEPMPSGDALAVLDDLFVDETHPTHVMVAAVDWSILKPIFEARRSRPFFAEVSSDTRPAGRGAERAGAPELATLLSGLDATERRVAVVAFLRDEVARTLGSTDPWSVDVDQGLFEMGMDSLMSVELKSRIETAVGRNLPSTLTFNYPSVAALTDYLLSDVLLEVAAAGPSDDPAGDVSAGAGTTPATDREAPPAEEPTESMSEDAIAAALATRLAALREDPS